MLIQDYASLTQAITDFTHRADLANNLYTDYFIQLAQNKLAADIITDNFGNGIQAMEVTLSPTAIAGGTLPLPGDWFAPKGLQIADGGGDIFPLIFKAATWIYDVYPIRQPEGLPAYIARDGGLFIFGPYPDSGYLVRGTYYSKGAPLSNAAPTNWMVLQTPEALHAACMIEAAKFLKDRDLFAFWEPIYKDYIEGIINTDKGERWASSTMQIELG